MTPQFDDKLQENDDPSKAAAALGFGNIKTSFFAYVTPLMCFIAIVVFAIIAFSAPKLYVFFSTNMALNGLIIGLGLMGIFSAFNNNIALWKVAKFLEEAETIRNKAKVSPEQVIRLQEKMVTQAPLLDTQNMYKALHNLESFGHYNFTDTDARLIKSKVGYRINSKKSDVSFLTGILVMLGLLGTFLGLLATIDAVGSALAGMAHLDIGEEGTMGKFIDSLSRPLQGMGLAFSSSLFGLSGSLLIGFFNFLCAGAQNDFIEHFSRWIDNRIPRNMDLGGKNKEGSGGGTVKPVPSALQFDQELKDWLSGYVALTVETNRQLKVLAQTLNETLDGFGRGEALLQEITQKQDTQITHVTQTNMSLAAQENILSQGNHILDTISKQNTAHIHDMHAKVYPFIPVFQDHLVTLLEMMQTHTETLDTGLSSVEQTLQMTHYNSQASLDNLNEKLFSISAASAKARESLEDKVSGLHTLLQTIDGKYEILPQIPEQLDSHLGQITKTLADAQKQQAQFLEIFKDMNGSSGPMAKMVFKMEKTMLAMNKKVFDMEIVSKKFVHQLVNKSADIEDFLTSINDDHTEDKS